MDIVLRISIAVILYTYIGYPLLLAVCAGVRRLFVAERKGGPQDFIPPITLIVPAYNEIVCVDEKIRNSFALDYPPEKLHLLFITDGSDDGTPGAVARYPRIQLLHEPVRRGKSTAINRAMQQVKEGIVVFTDANTLLNTTALRRLAKHYADARTGAVAGEKRVVVATHADATAGEGWYWKYESWVKRLESATCSVAGAAGELFSIRAALFEPLAEDTIHDDLFVSMGIAQQGWRVVYEPAAYATEQPSLTLADEKSRKLRIAAGDIQALQRIPFLRMLLRSPVLWWQYLSHRVLRWVVVPYLLPVAFFSNAWLVAEAVPGSWVPVLFYTQACFYLWAITGWLLRKTRTSNGVLFAPYYFCLMHANLVAGTWRYILHGQPVTWEKTTRR